MCQLQHENEKESFDDRSTTLHVLSIDKGSLHDGREKKIEYSSSHTFFGKKSSLLRKLARFKPRSSSYSLYIYPITPFVAIT
jgi:hypothetical protein